MARSNTTIAALQKDFQDTRESIRRLMNELDGCALTGNIVQHAQIKRVALELQSEVQDILSIVKDGNSISNPVNGSIPFVAAGSASDAMIEALSAHGH